MNTSRKKSMRRDRELMLGRRPCESMVCAGTTIKSSTRGAADTAVSRAIEQLTGAFDIRRAWTCIRRRNCSIEFRFEIGGPLDQDRCQLWIVGQPREFEKHRRLAFHILPANHRLLPPYCPSAGITRRTGDRS